MNTTWTGAVLSPDRVYRYRLWRRWDAGLFAQKSGLVNFLMLNPSVADGVRSDATLTRCINFAKRWGYSGLVVTNLFAMRSTDPAALLRHPDPIGPENDWHLLEAAKEASLVVVAWGAHPAAKDRSGAVYDLLEDAGIEAYFLRVTKGGHPEHPLRLPADLEPQRLPAM